MAVPFGGFVIYVITPYHPFLISLNLTFLFIPPDLYGCPVPFGVSFIASVA